MLAPSATPRKAEECADMEEVRAEIDRIDVSYLLHPSPEGPGTKAKESEQWSRSQGSNRQPER